MESTFWEDGTLKWEYHYYLHPETNDQIKEGWAREYCKTGELYSKVRYKEDEEHGLLVIYRWGGKVWQEREFSHGRLMGRDVTYYENGQVDREAHYVDGKKEGKHVYYDENGNITDEDIYRDDECVELCEERD